VCEIKVLARVKPKEAFKKAFQAMKRIDSLAGKEGKGSEIVELNCGKRKIVSQEVCEIIKEGLKISELTKGNFDITIGPVMKIWDFYEKKIPTEEEIVRAKKLVNYQQMECNSCRIKFNQKGMMLDLSGIAKGYAIDLAVKELKKEGVKTGLVNAGGDIRVFGDKIWKIGVQNPRGKGIIEILALKDIAVATSGDYEKYFVKDGKRYHHLINPKTGKPGEKCIQVTVITETATRADGLATGVFIMGEEGVKVLEELKVEGIIITKDGRKITTKGLKKYVYRKSKK
jgi:thiamine biosynthesis lipoprotein